MFCLYCEFYNGLDNRCKQDKNIYDYQEVLNCEHYHYTGEVKE